MQANQINNAVHDTIRQILTVAPRGGALEGMFGLTFLWLPLVALWRSSEVTPVLIVVWGAMSTVVIVVFSIRSTLPGMALLSAAMPAALITQSSLFFAVLVFAAIGSFSVWVLARVGDDKFAVDQRPS